MINFAQKAEDLGFDCLSLNEHIIFMKSLLNAVGTLSAIPTHTKRIWVAT
jgi:hypothetical protein